MHHRRLIIRFGFMILVGLNTIAAPGPDSDKGQHACSCADGRQFSIGSSLFGKGSARVVVKAFIADPAQTVSGSQLPACNDLTVVGQVVRLKTANDRPFLQRESLKRGTIRNICQTKIRFVEPKKSYDFFADDGSAVTLSDVDAGQTAPANEETVSSDEKQTDEASPDLTGKDLIQLIPREQAEDDPGASAFTADDLKEGAYCIVRRQLKALPAVDENGADVPQNGTAKSQREPTITVWAGTLGRVEKRAGFRSEPLWVVELLPHSAPLTFSRSLGLMFQALHRNHPFAKKVVLPASDVVEINHFFDQYRVEWTRFGTAAEDVQAREALGTTVLPDLYDPPKLTLEQNLKNAQKLRTFEAVQATALQLIFVPKAPGSFRSGQTLVLDEGSGPEAAREATPHLFRQQCFLQTPKTTASVLPVSGVDIRVFQPSHSIQVPDDYYAIDLRLQLGMDANGSGFPVVCRFPLTTIDVDLLNKAQRILSSQFEIRKRETK